MMLGGGMDKLIKPMIDKFQRDLEAARAELKEMTLEATSGGGMVLAKANGEGELLEVKFSAEAMAASDPEMLQDLVVAAVREVQDSAKRLKGEKLGGLMGGMNMLGMDMSDLM